MRTDRPSLSLLLAGALLATLFSLAAPSSARADMRAYARAMQPGWNLGNTLDAIPGETSWGNPPVTEAFIREIAAQGFKSIRIPVTWTDHTGVAPEYAIDPVWMERVQQIVDWSLQAGLYVMINVHHDSWQWADEMPASRDAVSARFQAIWTQIATRFADHSERLMFESINEPTFEGVGDAERMTLLDKLNTVFVRLVRQTGGTNATRPLVLPSVVTNAGQPFLDSLRGTMKRLNDPHLIATVHFYGYWPFSVNIAGGTRFDAVVVGDIVTQMDAVHRTFVAEGIPAVVGEYGLIAFDKDPGAVERGEMLKFFEYFTQYARSKDITCMWWDNGQHFDRATHRWRDAELYAIIRQSLSGRSSTADTDLIFLRDGTSVDDAVLTLNLNGNRFVSLQNGSTLLNPGVDYSIEGCVLTVKARVLSGYTSGTFGEKAVFTANFSSGPGWKIRVRFADTPVLSSAAAKAGGALAIPTAFKGDLLATVEAVYAGGGNAGPAHWTPFQQYDHAFAPNIQDDRITIKPDFFTGAKGRAIDLAFHFWSGQIVRYQISTKGRRVIGKPL